ncbi:hypothetical protein P3730_24860, partial [Vibrio parahaemolyticus]|nr:hypothetical protein [Vibrio parahaemolyticus]
MVKWVLFGWRRGSGLKKASDEGLLLLVTELSDNAMGTEAEAIWGVALVVLTWLVTELCYQ